ncbi:MAG TPA: EFR1 family ferrodoxin [Candidatus Bathyarchaeia archaeon]|nr:EFR1 family ferrodoxin [Candidatus Bathyarchaeia archaeon]
MTVDVYYFSGTGNSLVVARDIAEKTNGKLISIPSVISEDRIGTQADVVGVVFPVYGIFRIPSIVERFVRKLDSIGSKYIFAVSTYGNMAGAAVKSFGKVVESCGGKLSAGFAVKMPVNNISLPSFIYSGTVEDKERKSFANWRKKLDLICQYITARKQGKFEVSNRLLVSLFYPLDRYYGRWRIESKYNKLLNSHLNTDALWPMMDVSFHTDEKCDGCGICSRICPVNNIKMVESAPYWQHHCERCFACLQWCPKEAIQFERISIGRKRYHHPDVEISDMLKKDQVPNSPR